MNGLKQTILADFNKTSARIGKNPLLTQGAGGNTSIKIDDVMWIKASGQWLSDAQQHNIMVPVGLDALRIAHKAGEDVENTSRFLVFETNMRPSIETAMHAVMPQKVVIHVHCVETIAVAVRQDAEVILSEKLKDLDWVFVPYVRPGQKLADAIATQPGHDIYIFGNHGLTVGAETVAAAEALMWQVHQRLSGYLRDIVPPDQEALVKLCVETDYQPAPVEISSLGADPDSLRVTRTGSLYPDHVIFLGCGVSETLNSGAPLVVVAGCGALIKKNSSPSVMAMSQCLADIARRIPQSVRLSALTKDDEAALLGWDSEAYRQTLQRVGT